MYSILEQLYEMPLGTNSIPLGQNKELMELAADAQQKMEKLKNTLSKEQQTLLEKALAADSRLSNWRNFRKFKYGFELAMLLMMELYGDYEEMLS